MCMCVYVYMVSSKVFCYLGHHHVMMIKEAQLLIIWHLNLFKNFTYFIINKTTHSWTLKATSMTCLVRYFHWCNRDINIMGVTNHFLIGF